MTKKISALTAASVAAYANEFEINEAGTSKKLTGTQIANLIRNGDFTDIASATTTDLSTITTGKARITGTTTITGLGTAAAGFRVEVRFAGALTLTHNATSLILFGSNITTAANDTAEFISLGSGNWLCMWYKAVAGVATTVQVFTSSGTWTKPANLKAAIIEVRGGGGGGGGCNNAAAYMGASGGAQGGRSLKRVAAATLGATETVTIGAGGVAGANTGGDGGTGGTTSFGAHCQATGGVGGAGVTSAGMVSGRAGGAGSGGDANFTGQGGGMGAGISLLSAAGGQGGGEGGARSRAASGAGDAGVNGGGGGGASSQAASTASTGGAGGDGYVTVTEFY